MDYKYGYGEKGSFSFPSVPPACQLVYDVTMVTCEPPDEVGPGQQQQQRRQQQWAEIQGVTFSSETLCKRAIHGQAYL
jgi:hypothetical protein